MKVVRISTTEQLQRLADHWNRLTHQVPFRTYQWLGNWWHAYGKGRELFILTVYDSQEKLIGLAPWFIETCRSQGRVLKFLGSGEVCTDYLSVLCDRSRQDEVLLALAQWLTSQAKDLEKGPGHSSNCWDLIDFENIDTEDEIMGHFVDLMQTEGNLIHCREADACWRIPLPENWERYLSTLSKSHRKQVRRLLKRYLDPKRAILHTVKNLAELPSALKTLKHLHQKRRNSLGEPGCFVDERFTDFLTATAETLLPIGRLELHWMSLDGQAVAAEFHLVDGGVTYAYQAGVDPDMLDHEPGRLINIATIRHSIEQGRQAFDFLRGDEPYKAHWRAERRESIHLRMIPQRVVPKLRHQVWLTQDYLKGWVKSGLQLAGMR